MVALKELWSSVAEGLWPGRVLHSFWSFLTEPHRLAARASFGKLKSESKPIPFYLACFSLFTGAVLLHGEPKPSWAEAYTSLPAEQRHQFEHFFNLSREDIRKERGFERSPQLMSSDASRRIYRLVDSGGVATYLKYSGQQDLADAFQKAADRAGNQKSTENKITLHILPLIVVGLCFIPYGILKRSSRGTITVAALLYLQGFWLVLLAPCVLITNHWPVTLSTDRDVFAALAVIDTLGAIQIVHFVVVLFLATSASIERILVAGMLWQICALVAMATLQAAFFALNPFL